MMMENEDGEYGLSVMIENGGDDFLMEDEFSWSLLGSYGLELEVRGESWRRKDCVTPSDGSRIGIVMEQCSVVGALDGLVFVLKLKGICLCRWLRGGTRDVGLMNGRPLIKIDGIGGHPPAIRELGEDEERGVRWDGYAWEEHRGRQRLGWLIRGEFSVMPHAPKLIFHLWIVMMPKNHSFLIFSRFSF
ncbi:hypothetical protein V8G54_011060 [Vigna mungo]|uniref:Uncharacterized protein n=1 Tax=Vigna mungo TaxID=3915 RepID=A0AAQ3RZ93_VIGMU